MGRKTGAKIFLEKLAQWGNRKDIHFLLKVENLLERDNTLCKEDRISNETSINASKQ